MKHWSIMFLYLFAFSLLSIILTDYNRFYQTDYSLSYPFTSHFWDILGSSMSTSNYISLTLDKKSQSGAIWNNQPIPFKNWEIHVQFKIFGHGEHLYGDGLAVWYVKEPNQIGPVFGSKDFFNGLGIFIDTYSNQNGPHNHEHPYISAQVNNGSWSYDHDRDGTLTQLAGCHVKIRGPDLTPIIVIRYVSNMLEVQLTHDNGANMEQCLKVSGVHLPTQYYLGASAATGELSDNHQILSYRVFEIDAPHQESLDAEQDPSKIQPSADFFAPPRDHVQDPKHIPMTGKKLFLVIVLALIGLAVLFVVGVLVFKKQEESRKRLY